MEFKKLEAWMEENRKNKIAYLEKLSAAKKAWSDAYCEAFKSKNVRTVTIKDSDAVKNRVVDKEVEAIVLTINGKEYLYRYTQSEKANYYKDCGLGIVSKQDMQLIAYSKAEQEARVVKDIKRELEAILAKVKKICGDAEEIMDVADGYNVKGNKGQAHIWAIGAGGYNIQCYHIRVLVKEIKTK
jgi:hypothetical protein